MSRRSINAVVGYRRLPSHTRSNSRADYARAATQDVRASMAGVISAYSQFINGLKNLTPAILVEALQPTFDKSLEYCPVDTGLMIESGRIESSTDSKGRPRAAIIYGRPELFYTPIVHERLDLKHEAPTRAKWLQLAMMEDLDEFTLRVFRQLRGIA